MSSLHQANQGPVTARHSRRGFTLIELLMVIVIIGVLISLLLPAISSVRTRAKVTEVKVEIDNLASALADFKAKFGFYPPSRIVIPENPSSFSWPPASRAVIRRMFPQFDFTRQQDINDNGDKTEILTLTGAECLVFFLGGVQQNGVPIGFSKNPSRPFLVSGSNRFVPLFDFDAGRVQDVDGDGMREYVSPLSTQLTPYLYVSAYDGKGYRCAELKNSPGSFDVYRQKESEDKNRNCILDSGEDLNNNGRLDFGPAWKPKSFQIICAGFDDKYGKGGIFAEESAKDGLDPADYDNITNFHTGQLAP